MNVVHLVRDGFGTTRCCYSAPFDLPTDDRLTVDPDSVTCGIMRPVDDICGHVQVVMWSGVNWVHPMDMGVCDRPPEADGVRGCFDA